LSGLRTALKLLLAKRGFDLGAMDFRLEERRKNKMFQEKGMK
jgi:hypothetical protein